MADKPSGGDNKIHQIVMALITTIAAPIVVFLVTNNLKSNSAAAPTVPPAITATLPSGATASQPTPTKQSQPTQAGISNPSGSIPAGVPALVDGLVLTISAQDVHSDGQDIHVSVHVRNPGDQKRTLVFTPGAIGVQDDTRHRYEPFFGDKKSGCKKNDISVSKHLDIASQGEVTLKSVSSDQSGAWCADGSGGAIPLFSGPIGKGARKLAVQINGVGPFKGFQVEIDL